MIGVGDWVKWKKHEGQVLVIDEDGWYGVDFGPTFDGHSLHGKIPRATGWFLSPEWEIISINISLENK